MLSLFAAGPAFNAPVSAVSRSTRVSQPATMAVYGTWGGVPDNKPGSAKDAFAFGNAPSLVKGDKANWGVNSGHFC